MCGGIQNTEFRTKYKPNCQDSCFDKDKSAQCGDDVEKSGCACKTGFFLDAELNCVPDAVCKNTCRVDLPNGESLQLNVRRDMSRDTHTQKNNNNRNNK